MAASGDTAIGSRIRRHRYWESGQSRLQTSDSGRQGSALYGEAPKNATQTHLPPRGEARRKRGALADQAAYVSPATRVACLPKLQEDVTRILNTSVPGCILPKFGHANVRNHAAPNEEDCDVAARLYHEDFEIWRAHCGS